MTRLYLRPIGGTTEEMIWLTPSYAVNVKAALALGLVSKDEILEIKRQEDRELKAA
jgi:hypothetical protein